jgi:Ca-activated chloride channel homolog
MTGHRALCAVLVLAAWRLAVAPAAGQTVRPQQQSTPQAALSQAQSQAFRSGIDVVSLTVTVTDPAGRYVTDLSGDDFVVLEDGARQEIGFFNRTSLPLSVALLVDSSASMEDKMRTTQAAALGFVESLRPQDQAQVVDFDSRVDVLVPFTGSRPDLAKAIRSLVAGGSTSLYNAIYVTLKQLKATGPRAVEDDRRLAIIVLSDGEDTSSLVSYDEVLELAKRSETAIYAIGIHAPDPGASKGYSEADFVLRQLTSQTGGRAFFPGRVSELPAIYELISQELSSQYLLGYTSSNTRRDGQWRRVAVRTSRAGATARTRLGYYGPAR